MRIRYLPLFLSFFFFLILFRHLDCFHLLDEEPKHSFFVHSTWVDTSLPICCFGFCARAVCSLVFACREECVRESFIIPKDW